MPARCARRSTDQGGGKRQGSCRWRRRARAASFDWGMRARPRGITAFALAACGCSLFADLGGLTGGEGDAPPPDAGLPDGPEASLDAGRDTGAEGGGPFCLGRVPAPTFCKDFDSQVDVDEGWDFHLTPGPASTMELDTAVSLSPPKSLRVALPSAVPGTGSGMSNRIGMSPKQGVGATKRAHFEMAVRLDQADPQRQPYLATLSLGATTAYAIILWANGAEAGIREEPSSQPSVVTPFTRNVALGAWTHVELDVDFTASPASVTAKIDGAVALDRHPLVAGYQTGGSSFSVGLSYYTSATVAQTSAHFDDVLYDVE